MFELLFSHLDGQRDTVITLQRELTAIPALGPQSGGTGEEAKAEYILGKLRAFGVQHIRMVNAPDTRVPCGHRPNILALIPGHDTSKTFWIIAHIDVVPPGDPSLWHTDPYTLHVDDDTIIGRGVEDNQQAIVSCLLMAHALQTHEISPAINVGFLFVADEETGNDFGLEYILKTQPDTFGPDDLILVSDWGGPDSTVLEVAEKSVLWLRVSVTGRQCHASVPHKGINSLTAAAAMILEVQHLHKHFAATDPLFVPPISTFAPTKKEANVPNINTVPGSDVFYIDCRVLPEYDLRDVLGTVHDIAHKVEKEYGVDISIDPLHQVQAAPPTRVDAPVVHTLQRAIRHVYNVEAEPVGIGGGTVAAPLRQLGLAVAAWSTIVSNAHTPNERSSIASTINDAKVMLHMALKPGA